MARDYELDRLFDAKQTAWRESEQAKQRMNELWDESKRLQDRYGSEVDQLRDEHDRTYEKMKEAFADASRAFEHGEHEDARMYADQGKEYKAELPDLVERRRDLVEQLKAAREAHKEARAEYFQAKERFNDARDEHDSYRDERQRAKEAILQTTDIPDEYQDDAFLRENPDGSKDIFFGGIGEPSGPGHGHYHYDADNKLEYQRDPFDPHGPQNFTDHKERRSEQPHFDSQYYDDGQASGLTYGGSRTFEPPVHGTDEEGRDVTVSFGREGTKYEDQTLIADGHLTSEEFYQREPEIGHDHSHPSDPRNEGYEDRNKYSG